MRILGRLRRALYLRALRWAIAARSHPLRTRYILALSAFLICAVAGRGFLSREIPVWVSDLGHAVFQSTQVHPVFGRFIRVVINAVPDSAFALLAIAGLAYLAPGFIKKLEELLWARIVLLVVFVTFGCAAIVINAVNREAQSFQDEQNNDRMGVVLRDVTDIQDSLSPKNSRISEAERREKMLTALRDQYILLPGPVDPDILSGKKSPPADWVNAQLKRMKEDFTVRDEPSTAPVKVIQQIMPEQKRARVVFSFFQGELSADSPRTVSLDAMDDSTAHASIEALVGGDVPAKNLQIWLRTCSQGCKWLPPYPPGFQFDTVSGYDITTRYDTLDPNVASGKWDVSVHLPSFPKVDSVPIAAYYACDNCETVDWNKPQVLWVTRTMQAGFRVLSPPLSKTPSKIGR